jgi:hypothetical protein
MGHPFVEDWINMDPFWISITAIIISLISLGLYVDLRARVNTAFDISQRQLERSSSQDKSRHRHSEEPGFITPVANASQQPVSAPLRAAETPPQAVAPKLKKPPVPKGGFGSKVRATHVSKKSSEEGDKD